MYKLGHANEYDVALADADPEDEGAFEDADGNAAHAEEAAKPEMGSPHADAIASPVSSSPSQNIPKSLLRSFLWCFVATFVPPSWLLLL